jgi:hypothetical protein
VATLRLDRNAEPQPITVQRIEHIGTLNMINANGSDLSQIMFGSPGETNYVAKKEQARNDGLELDADGSTLQNVDTEGRAKIRAKDSKLKNIKHRASSGPQRIKSIGGVAAIFVGGALVAFSHESGSPTSFSASAFGTKWSLVTGVPGIVIALFGVLVLVFSRGKE